VALQPVRRHRHGAHGSGRKSAIDQQIRDFVVKTFREQGYAEQFAKL
jgi:hypothetical protein